MLIDFSSLLPLRSFGYSGLYTAIKCICATIRVSLCKDVTSTEGVKVLVHNDDSQSTTAPGAHLISTPKQKPEETDLIKKSSPPLRGH